MELKERLSLLMKRRGFKTAADLSRATGLTQVAIRNYMRGIKVPNSQALKKLSDALGTTMEYLLVGTPQRPYRIPLLSAIPGGEPLEFTDGEYPPGFAGEYIDRGDIDDPNAFALIVQGDSMEPRIKSGDIVIIAPNKEVINRSIAAVKINSTQDRTLKRVVYMDDGNILLQPENEKYEPALYHESDITLIGRVIERREKL